MIDVNETDERYHLLKIHPCSRDLSSEALREIAEACELLHCPTGHFVHRANDPMTSVYLIIHGRVRMDLVDVQGNIVLRRYHVAGDQLGGLAAVLGEPAPMNCIAEEPSTMLKIDYAASVKLSKKYDAFRVNFTKLMAEAAKRSVFNDRLPSPPRLIAFFHQTDQTRIVSQKLFKRLIEMGENPGVFMDQPEDASIPELRQRQIMGGERNWSLEEAIQEAGRWLETGRVFIDYSTRIGADEVARVMERCQLVFWCVTPENWQDSLQFLRDAEARSVGWRDKVRLLWLLSPGEVAPLASDLRQLANRDIKISFGSRTAKQGQASFNGFERLVHLIRGITIGVALGGGAARGMAHLGVLKALEQNGIVVDMIAGTSAGAMTGTLYAAGLDADYLVDCFVQDLRPNWFFRHLPRGDQWHLLYKYRMGRFDPMLRKYLKDMRLEQLSVPMHTVTVDLIGGQSLVREGGDAVHAILESINLPVLSKPINRPGQALVDGGLINNIPADVLVSKGCNFVIAVSVTAKMETEFARNRPDTPFERMRSASTIQTILRSFLVQSSSVNAIGVQPADFVVEPDVSGFELTEFTRTDELAAIGEETTKWAIPEIKKLLHRIDSQLFAPVED
jgi:predicted acylesterase/phospholipase RssA/CRP-like cAMP-binding protein